jgi:hypothetical protein
MGPLLLHLELASFKAVPARVPFICFWPCFPWRSFPAIITTTHFTRFLFVVEELRLTLMKQ